MNADHRGNDPDSLPLPLADQVDRICDRYEAELARGASPRIESYLPEIAREGRDALFGELLAAELEWRRRRGERPHINEYAGRFPDNTEQVRAEFDAMTPADIDPYGPGSTSPLGAADLGRRPRATRQAPGAGLHRPDDAPIPGHRLIERIGRGGFGEVWKAEAPGGVAVALKFIRLEEGEGEIELRAFETIKGIRHPNLLALFGAWQARGQLILGMELADGTLMDRLKRAHSEGSIGVPGPELIELFAEAAKGIDYLNGRVHRIDGRERVGVQHRDIKPQNILLVGGGVKVGDFGLARLLDGTLTGHTGSLTPSYAAPEFFQGQTSDRSDQYSLAVTYCLLRGGRLPFRGEVAALVDGHLHRPPDLTMLPPSERPIVARALAKSPSQRWPDCRSLVEALRAHLGADPHAGDGPIDAMRPGPRAGRPRPLRRIAAVLACTLIAAAVAIVPGIRRGDQPAPRPHPRPAKASKPALPKISSAEGKLPIAPIVGKADPARKGPALAASLGEEGALHYNEGDFEEAIVSYSEAIEIDPGDAIAFNNRGNAYAKLGLGEAAIEDYDRAIALDPGSATIRFNRGNASMLLDRLENAIQDYTEAIRLDPRHAGAYANRAIARERLGDTASADSDRAQAAHLEM